MIFRLVLWCAFCLLFSLSSFAQQGFDPTAKILIDSAFAKNDYEAGLPYIFKAIDLLVESGDNLNLGNGYIWLGQYHSTYGEYLKLKEAFQKSLEIFRSENDSSYIATGLNNLAIAHEYNGEFEESLSVQEESLKINLALADSANISGNYNSLGALYSRKGQRNRAVEMFKKSVYIDSILKRETYALGLANLADSYFFSGLYPEAIRFGLRALDENFIHDEEVNFIANYVIGRVYLRSKDFAKSKERFLLSKKFAQKTYRSRNVAAANDGLCEVYEETGKYQKALSLYRESLPLVDIHNRGKILNNIGGLYLEPLQDIDSARFYFEKSFAISKQIGAPVLSLQSSVGLMSSFYEREEYETALIYLDSALLYRGQGETQQLSDDVLLAFSKVYYGNGYKDVAISYIDSAYQRIIRDTDSEKDSRNILNSYEILKKDNEIYKQKISLDLETRKATESSNRFLLATVLALFVAVFGFFQYRERKKEQILKDKLSEQNTTLDEINKMLEIARNDIFHRVKNDFQAVSSMVKLQASYISDLSERKLLEATADRVEAMGVIHNCLHGSAFSKGADKVDSFKDLVAKIAVARSYRFNERKVNIHADFEDDLDDGLGFSQVSWLGMMVNELITNACKYAEADNGEVDVFVRGTKSAKNGGKLIEVSNAKSTKRKGLPEKDNSGVGISMMEQIAAQLGWQLSYVDNGKSMSGIISIN